VRGAFTSATRDRIGRIELADGGTLFLDEVAEIPAELQAKLLRPLQDSTFERVGESLTRRADVRFVVATNRNLAEEVAAGRFRRDLYYRLSVFPIEVPPLRARPEDIPVLVEQELASHAATSGRRYPPRRCRSPRAHP
jgi:transcriptional regulator with GAF, ATPase, and Fis domain